MAKLSSEDKFKRVMKFLVASTEPPIAQLLSQWGFTEEDRKEGWALLDAAAGRHLAMPDVSGTFQTRYNAVRRAGIVLPLRGANAIAQSPFHRGDD